MLLACLWFVITPCRALKNVTEILLLEIGRKPKTDFSADVLMGWMALKKDSVSVSSESFLCKRAKMEGTDSAMTVYLETDPGMISKELWVKTMLRGSDAFVFPKDPGSLLPYSSGRAQW